MYHRWYCVLVLIGITAVSGFSQTAPAVGIRDKTPSVHALTDVRIVTAPGRTIERGSIIMRDGIIENAGPNVPVPADASVREMNGMTVYAGFIDLDTGIGIPDPEEGEGSGAFHWNPQVRPHINAATAFRPDSAAAGKMRSQGFTLALTAPKEGIFRGSSAIVSLADGTGNELIVRENVSQSVSFVRSNKLGAGYPTSLMGAVALVRQTLSDADWYIRAHDAYAGRPAGSKQPQIDIALASLRRVVRDQQPALFTVSDELDFLRATGLAEEFSLKLWIRGSGHEYKRVHEIRETGVPVILPVSFPSPPDVSTPELARDVSLQQLRYWYHAPENPMRLARAGVRFSLTTAELENTGEFLSRLREAVRRGLEKDAALAALTTTPAELLGLNETHGTVERGKAAHLIVTDGDIFEEGTSVLEVWIDGNRFEVDSRPDADLRGTWAVVLNGIDGRGELTLHGTPSRLEGALTVSGSDADIQKIQRDLGRISFHFAGDSIGIDGRIIVSGTVSEREMYGTGTLPDGGSFTWRANRTDAYTEESEEKERKPFHRVELPDVYPAMEYGIAAPPEQPEHIFVRNATIWTQGPEGVIENGDLLIRRGAVAAVGRNLSQPRNALVIDATGKHVTPGLIDAHIHTSISGSVNEFGNAVSAEVRIEDVLNSNNIWIYRLLAGGLTTANALHGSANPIGGQNAIIKMRWGALPDGMLVEDAPPGIKFALGENVKRTQSRYPNTRMGVEQIIRDEFQAAREYEERRQEWERSRSGIPPRRDYRLEAIVEVLNGERDIHSHCYRQDEILTLIRVAEDFGVNIRSFQHTLEGYKIAEALREHGASAAVWSDWWAFKVEAYDATTYNARLLHEQGVLTVIHSDNTQLATRMNWEAAKVAGTGVSEIDALSMITIYAARMLGIDHRVGSLEEGKDADFVIWSMHPLSSQTRAEQTWIEGRKYFDVEDDLRLREEVRRQRGELIQAAHRAMESGVRPRLTSEAASPFGESNHDDEYSCVEADHEIQ
jgi:imidazolonepropionase-like amidohydrolase